MRLVLALAVSLLACTSGPPATPPATLAPPPTAAPPAAAPVAADVPAAEAPPPAAPAPRIADTALRADELLVLRAPLEPHLRALHRGPSDPNYRECELISAEPHAHLDLVRGEIRVGKREPGGPVGHRCEVVRVDEKFTRLEHPIRPLTRDHLGELVLGLPPAEQTTWLSDPDLEKAPLRGFVGGESGLVVFANGFLNDLGTHFAIPARPLLTRAELEADLASRRAAGQRVARLNRPDLFAPQVRDSGERLALGKLPVLSVCAPENYQAGGPTAVPLRVGDETRYLMFQSHMMKASWEAAFRRGRVIERVLDAGARAG